MHVNQRKWAKVLKSCREAPALCLRLQSRSLSRFPFATWILKSVHVVTLRFYYPRYGASLKWLFFCTCLQNDPFFPPTACDLLRLSPPSHCSFLPVAPPGDLDAASLGGSESEKSRRPLKRWCGRPRTSPTGWRSRRRPCTLRSPGSPKAWPRCIAKEALGKKAALLFLSPSVWVGTFGVMCEARYIRFPTI